MLELIIEEVYENKGKILVFSQYVETLIEIEKKLKFQNVNIFHGGLNQDEKNTIIENFKNTDEPSAVNFHKSWVSRP